MYNDPFEIIDYAINYTSVWSY